jgi:hypothetical protein
MVLKMSKIYILKIGYRYNEMYDVEEYSTTKKSAIDRLKQLGYNHYHKDYGLWEQIVKYPEGYENNGEWAKIEEIKKVEIIK